MRSRPLADSAHEAPNLAICRAEATGTRPSAFPFARRRNGRSQHQPETTREALGGGDRDPARRRDRIARRRRGRGRLRRRRRAGAQRARSANPYRGDGMWIWYVSRSSGGDLARIARKAHRHGIETVYIKSSDGISAWSQFTREPGLLPARPRPAGLRLAVRLRHPSRRRGAARRGGGSEGRRLPGDRRRVDL